MSAATPTMGGAPAVPAAPVISVPSATGVDAHLVLAGPGARSFAFLIDWLIRSGLSMVYLLVAALLILGNLDFEIDPDRETLWYLAGATAGDGYLLPLPPDPRAADGRPHARQAAHRSPRAHARGPGAHDRRTAHAQCVSHHRFHAAALRGGTAVRVLQQTASASRRSCGRHRDRDGARSVPRKTPLVAAGMACSSTARRVAEPPARQQCPRRTRGGRRLSTSRARSRQCAPGAHARNRSVDGISRCRLFGSARHHPPARATPGTRVVVPDARPRACRHERDERAPAGGHAAVHRLGGYWRLADLQLSRPHRNVRRPEAHRHRRARRAVDRRPAQCHALRGDVGGAAHQQHRGFVFRLLLRESSSGSARSTSSA